MPLVYTCSFNTKESALAFFQEQIKLLMSLWHARHFYLHIQGLPTDIVQGRTHRPVVDVRPPQDV